MRWQAWSTTIAMDHDMITAYDEAGNVVFISRLQWASEVLPNTFADAWDDADRLYGHLAMAIDDGFADCTHNAVRRLLQLEPSAKRAQALQLRAGLAPSDSTSNIAITSP
jgi:hypothetical protein